MSRANLGDFDVITGPPAPLRRMPAAAGLKPPAEPAAADAAKRKPAEPDPGRRATP